MFLKDFFTELKRRKVIKAGVAYAVVAWVVVQALSIAGESFGAPPWFMKMIIVVVLLGFPVALVLAWAYEMTPEGVKRTQEDKKSETAVKKRGKVLNRVIAVGLVLAVGFIIYDKLISPSSPVGEQAEEEQASTPAISSEKSIAVLPFAAITRTEEDEIFCDGIHDDILTQLAKVGDLHVLARTTVARYRNTEKRLSEISKELGAMYILEGSVRRVGSRIRITAQLIDGKTEGHLWAEEYDRDYSDIFAIQSDVAQRVAQELKATLTSEEKNLIERIPTENLMAYEYYLKGNYYWDKGWDLETNVKAAEMYERAVELDPGFVLAYARLVMVDATLYAYSTSKEERTEYRLEKCRNALDRAIELGADVAEVHMAHGIYLQQIEKNHEEALKKYLIALQGLPNNSELLYYIGNVYERLGEVEKAVEYLIRGYQLNPYGLWSGFSLATAYIILREWPSAEQWITTYIAHHPENPYGYLGKAQIYAYGYGDLQKARTVLDEAEQRVRDHPGFYTDIRWILEMYSREYPKALQVLESDPDPQFLLRALVWYHAGEGDLATAYFDSARSYHEELIKDRPDIAQTHANLGLAFAGLHRRSEALRERRTAHELYPVDPTYYGWNTHLQLTQICIMVGDYDGAIAQIDSLLSMPSELTRWRLRLDPAYDPLRNDPKFQKFIRDEN